MFGENYGVGTLKKTLVRIAEAIRDGEAYFGDTTADDCRHLMEGALVLWLRESEEAEEERMCRTKQTVYYEGTPHARYGYTCEQTGEEYAMRWVPRHCPECGGTLVVTGEEVWDG